MKILKFLLFTVITLLFWYLTGVYYEVSFDMTQWHENTRGVTISLFCFTVFVYLFIKEAEF